MALEVEPRATERGEAEQGEASEEQWAHRINRRLRALKIGKATMEYRWYSEQKREDSEPLTPDPTDRSVSKRKWKYCVTQWRDAIQQRYLEAEQRGSVHDCQSVDTETTASGQRLTLRLSPRLAFVFTEINLGCLKQ